jgi:iron complex outermembrane recepter protein
MQKKLSFAISALIATAPAFAQNNTSAQNTGAPPALEEVVITGVLERQAEAAGRLGLSNRETPAIVDVLTQVDLQFQGVRSVVEAMNAAPGVASGTLPGSMGSVSMRGFHRAVNYLYDGVRMANSDVGMRNWDTWAFERVEVIKGPASVTSGEGALAGAINFVPRRPELGRSSAELLASVGSFGTERLAADLNVPLSETLASRFNASWSRTEGWIDETDSDTLAASGAITFKPDERFSLTLRADYLEDDYSTIYYGTPLVSRSVARNPSNAVSGSAGLVLDKAMRDLNFNVADGDMGSDTLWLRAQAEYRLTDAMKIVSDTSWYSADRIWQDADEYSFNAGSGLIDRSMTLITHDHDYWNQRIHLAYDGSLAGMRNRFTIGAELGATDFFTKRRFGTASAADPFNPVRGNFPTDMPANFGTRQNVTADVQAWALFVEDALNLTPEWLLAGGIRFDNFKLDRTILNVTPGTSQTYGQDYEAVSWRLGTVYSLTPETQLFAQYTSAVTPLSGLLFMSATNASFDLTTGYSYEAGIKTSLTGQGVELTASVFKIRQDDILTRDPANPAVVFQGGNLQSEGVEVAINLPATEQINISLSGTVLDAKYGELIEGGGVNRAGKLPQNVPERLADLVVSYSPPSLPLSISGIARYSGSFYTSNANTVKISAYTTFDAALAWEGSFGSLTLRGRNLSDEFYADWSGYAAGLVFIGAPRSVELSYVRRY